MGLILPPWPWGWAPLASGGVGALGRLGGEARGVHSTQHPRAAPACYLLACNEFAGSLPGPTNTNAKP